MSVHRPASGKFISGLYRCYPYGPGRLEFGIETFYVPEGTGHRYEDAARQWHLTAEIALAPWGQAKLRGLRIFDRQRRYCVDGAARSSCVNCVESVRRDSWFVFVSVAKSEAGDRSF